MTSVVFWPFLTYLPTMSDDFYPIASHIWELFWTPLPTLKSDVIYGRSHRNFIPAPLASQSAPLMNTCWPVLRTCNSNTFVLFWASCIQKKNFYNPKITPLQIMFSKRFFLLLRRKKISANYAPIFYIIKQNKTEMFFQFRFSGTSTKLLVK